MHILGKVSLWLCMLVLIPLAIVFSTMALDIRNHWLTQFEKERAQLASTTKQLEEAESKMAALDEEYLRLTRTWGEIWTGPGRPMPNIRPTVGVTIGGNSGLPTGDVNGARQTVFVFAEAENQPTRYLGHFAIVAGGGDNVVLELTRDAFPGEVEAWPVGNYHLRRNLPSNWLVSPSELHAQILEAEAQLSAQQVMLQTVQNQVKASTAVLNARMAELNGNNAPVTGASQEVKDGLVETIRKFETERNQLLAQTDTLRRELDASYVRLRGLLDSNNRNAEQLKLNSSNGSPEAPALPRPQASRPLGRNPSLN